MRFSLAREAGLTESLADQVDEGFDGSDLAPAWKTALSFTDHMLLRPGPLPAELRTQLDDDFDEGELVELALGLGLFHGFSKMLIALGLEPDEMETTVVPTPAPLGVEERQGDPDPRAAVLDPRPDLRRRWEHMARRLASLEALPAPAMQAIDARAATLLGAPWAAEARTTDPLGVSLVELTELFLVDVRAITADQLSDLQAEVGDAGVVQAVMAMAVSDGIARTAVTLGG